MKNLFKTFFVFIIVAIMQYTVFTLFYCMAEQTIKPLPLKDGELIVAYAFMYIILIILAFIYLDKESDYYK